MSEYRERFGLTRKESSANSASPATTMSCLSRSAPLDVRGRASSSGPLLDAILGRHDYPEPVARLLAEACVLTVLLGTSLKFEGKFILQTPYRRAGRHAGCRLLDAWSAARLCALRRRAAGRGGRRRRVSAEKLLGTGVLALTIDQGAHTQRYQGIVELDGTSLEEAARTYFRQSEQIPTDIRLAVAKHDQRRARAAASIGAPAG